jgi:D-glycero-D-manno-heptose 1,7-bisphosphate phosphatase
MVRKKGTPGGNKNPVRGESFEAEIIRRSQDDPYPEIPLGRSQTIRLYEPVQEALDKMLPSEKAAWLRKVITDAAIAQMGVDMDLRKVWLLDLDGTVRYAKNGKFPGLDNQVVYPEAEQLIKDARSHGIAIVGVSNQGGVEKGFKSLETCREEMEQLRATKLFDFFCFCPHFEGSGDSCHVFDCDRMEWAIKDKGNYRKPSPGMLYLGCELARSHPSRALMVGDRAEDKEAALLAAINFIDAEEWRKSSELT